MALTDDEKAQCRRYLGFPDINRQYDLALEAAMDAISAEGERYIRDLLEELDGVQIALRGSRTRLKTKKVEDVVLGHIDEVMGLREEGNRLAFDLGTALMVQPVRLPFTSGGGAGLTRRG